MATAYLKGVSTRRMDDLVKSLGITGMSKCHVSTLAKDLDSLVADFRTRPLDAGPYLYLSADALTIKVREGGRVVKTSVLLATGINAEGYREILGMLVATAESTASWNGFFRDLKARGPDIVGLITSDAHCGIQHSIGDVFPDASWQRCRTHYAKNLSEVVPKSEWKWVRTMFQSIFDQETSDRVWSQVRAVVDMLDDKLPTAATHRRRLWMRFWRSPRFRSRRGRRCGPTIRRSGRTRRSAGGPMSWGSFLTVTRWSGWSGRCWPSSMRTGCSRAGTCR